MTSSSEHKLIQGNKLHKLLQENSTADNLAHYLAARERIRGFTDIKRLNMDAVREEKFEINEKDSENFFKTLEAEGYGVIVRPRKLGGRSRFLWKYDMRKVCDAAINGKDVHVLPLPPGMQRDSDASRKPKHKVTRTRKPIVVESPKKVVVNLTKPDIINLNGEEYIKMSQEEYNRLNKFKKLLSQLQK